MQGYIKLHRGILDNPLFKSEPYTKGQAWITLLLLTNHKEGYISIKNGEMIKIERGECGYSELALSDIFKWSRGKVNRFLKLLENEKMIQQKNISNRNIIKILNYELYQNDTVNSTVNGHLTIHQTDINNNDKNEKNEKNDKNNNIIGEVEIIKNSVDPYADSLIDECFTIYQENCPDLCKLRFERRSKDIRELTAKVLTEIDRDIGVFTEICKKANCLKVIVDKQIDFKKMLNCYQGILNGKYNVVSSPLEESRDELIKRINARLDKTTERGY